MKNLYNQYGLQTVINASGRMTKLGVSTISEKVGKAIMEGGSNYVVLAMTRARVVFPVPGGP